MDRVKLTISGRVQGIGFRAAAYEAAHRFHVVGWVRNLSDGRVQSTVEGTADAVREFIAWCRQGPAGSEVVMVKIEREEATGEFKEFTVAPTSFEN